MIVLRLFPSVNKINEENKVAFSEGELHQLREDKNKLLQQKDTINNKKDIFDNISVLLKDSGIKAQIVKKYIPVINKHVNKFTVNFYF